ncbi:MAG: asparagine--tRNA ligase, partial [Clostridia bacterium]|nr:asparagine--tRNA ligase [Clostridia bacterium]
MKREFIKDLYEHPELYGGKTVTLGGWVRNLRESKAFGFIDLNDGSYFKSAQVVFERDKIDNYDEIAKQNVGAALIVTGVVELTPTMKQPFEIKATVVAVEGTSTPEYPLQPKRHSVEFLREQAYLRPRTNLFSAVFRVRSEVAYAIHNFFHSRGFVYV